MDQPRGPRRIEQFNPEQRELYQGAISPLFSPQGGVPFGTGTAPLYTSFLYPQERASEGYQAGQIGYTGPFLPGLPPLVGPQPPVGPPRGGRILDPNDPRLVGTAPAPLPFDRPGEVFSPSFGIPPGYVLNPFTSQFEPARPTPNIFSGLNPVPSPSDAGGAAPFIAGGGYDYQLPGYGDIPDTPSSGDALPAGPPADFSFDFSFPADGTPVPF